MRIAHLLLVVLVVAIWGCNFIFIKLGLREVSPLLFCAIRFFLASVPAIFFIKFPNVSFRAIALYGLIMFGLQFSFTFIALNVGMTAGLASIIIQTQVFFSIIFAMIMLDERPSPWQIIGALISFGGIALIATHLDKNVSLAGLLLILAAAATWGIGNLISKKIAHVNVISVIVCGSFVACFPLLLLSFIFEGPERIMSSFRHINLVGGLSILYVVYLSTWVGYGAWNMLLRHYPVSTIVPFTLLVPVFGMLSSVLVLGESFQSWKVLVAVLVVAGLCINLLGTRIFARVRLKKIS